MITSLKVITRRSVIMRVKGDRGRWRVIIRVRDDHQGGG